MDPTPEQAATDKLHQLGFTQLESMIYVHLLRQGECTGYAVAQALGKAVANTYKGVESLVQKGAIEVTAGKSRVCRAVPWKQLLADQRSRFDRTVSELASCLEALPEAEDDESVVQLENFDRVIAESRRIVDESEAVLVGDLEPAAVGFFADHLEAAAARGVEVRIKIYEPIEIPGVTTVLRAQGKQVYARTPDVRMQFCADGREALMALFDLGLTRVLQAFRSRSSLMNLQIYSGQLYELILTELKPLVLNGDLDGARGVFEATSHLHPFSAGSPPLQPYIDRYDR